MIDFLVLCLFSFDIAIFSSSNNSLIEKLQDDVRSLKHQLITAGLLVTLSTAPKKQDKEDIFVLKAVKGDETPEMFSSCVLGKTRLYSSAVGY